MASQRTLLTADGFESGSFRRCCPQSFTSTATDNSICAGTSSATTTATSWHLLRSYPASGTATTSIPPPTPAPSATYASFKKSSSGNRPRFNPLAIGSKASHQPLHAYSNCQTVSSSATSSSYYCYGSAYSPNGMYMNSAVPSVAAYRYDHLNQQPRYHSSSAINEHQLYQEQQQQQQQQQQRHLYFSRGGNRSSDGFSGGGGGGGGGRGNGNQLYCMQSCCQSTTSSPSSMSTSSFYSRPGSKKYLAETNTKLNLREFLETWNENSDEPIGTATTATAAIGHAPEQFAGTDESVDDTATPPTSSACYDLDRIFTDETFWLSTTFTDDNEVARMIDELNYECRSKMADIGSTNADDDDSYDWSKYDSGTEPTTLLPIT